MLCNHCLKTVVYSHLTAAFNKHSKQISFAVRIVLLDKVVDICTQVAGSGIWRIRTGNPIFPRHRLTDINESVQLLGGIFHAYTVHADLTVGIFRCHKPTQ